VPPPSRPLGDLGQEGYCIAELDTDFIVETRNRRRYLQDYRPSLFLNPGFYR
jgi:hypothetical protein